MKLKSVTHVLPASRIDMGGLPVDQAFPTHQVDQVDPFLLLHHARFKVPQFRDPRHSGVDPHPHRGFSPVTFIFEGGVHHRDSRGNNAVVYAPGAQWMNAGMGVIHSERPPADIHERGGVQEIIQLWVNTPAHRKMEAPEYFPVQATDMPEIAQGSATIRLVSGELFGQRGPVTTATPVTSAMISWSGRSTLTLAVPQDHNSMIYVLKGELRVAGFGQVDARSAVVFGLEGDAIELESANAQLLYLSGLPLKEKVTKHGPFVMTTQTEILEAMRDYQMGKMGMLIEE